MTSKVNVTVQYYAPVISFAPSGAWLPEDYQHYGTYGAVTGQNGAYASFTFNGTAFWLVGSKWSNHGPFNVTIDGVQHTANGSSNVELFQQIIYSSEIIGNGEHEVVLTNVWTLPSRMSSLDLQSITYETQVSSKSISQTHKDTDSAFNYSGSWSTKPSNVSQYFSGTGHTTAETDSSVTFSFQGEAVQIIGAIGPDCGGYAVQVDNGPISSTYNATRSIAYYQSLMYETNSLSQGSHTVTLINKPFYFGQRLNIDYAVVTTVPSASSSKSNTLPAAVAATIGAVALIIMVYFCYRRRFMMSLLEARRRRGRSGRRLSPQGGENASNVLPITPPAKAAVTQPARAYQLFGDSEVELMPPSQPRNPPTSDSGTRESGQELSEEELFARLQAARLRVPGRPQDIGPLAEDDLHDLPPDYEQATEPIDRSVLR